MGSGEAATIIRRRNFVKEMSPRKYDMSRRASAAAQTRRRIIEATRELHAEQGIGATSWDAIAARAGVGVGTVYRHFPSLDELVPACGEVSMKIVALPDPDDAPALFEGLRTPGERLARLVREAFAIYERGSRELQPVRREPDVHPSVAAAGEALEASLSALVDSALEPLDADPQDRAVARAMIDLNTWEALRSAGLDAASAVAAVSEMLATRMTARASARPASP
jgi:AcrR family transcriptional regulator